MALTTYKIIVLLHGPCQNPAEIFIGLLVFPCEARLRSLFWFELHPFKLQVRPQPFSTILSTGRTLAGESVHTAKCFLR